MNCPHCGGAVEDSELMECPMCQGALTTSNFNMRAEKAIADTYDAVHATEHEKREGTTHKSHIVHRFELGEGKRPQSAVLHGGSLLVLSIDPGDAIVVYRFALDGKPMGALGNFTGTIEDPAGIALDDHEHVYLLDGDGCTVVKLAAGAPIATFGPNGMSSPRDLEVAGDGSMLLADTGNHRILRWNAEGERTISIGPDVDEEEGETGSSGTELGMFDTPSGVTCDEAGSIYVADTNNHRIQVFDASGTFVRTFGSEGEGQGQLLFPTDVRIGGAGDVFVFDLHGRRVQKFRPDGSLAWGIPVGTSTGVSSVAGDIDVGSDERIYVPLPAESAVVCVQLVE